jgi:hypothetical protein
LILGPPLGGVAWARAGTGAIAKAAARTNPENRTDTTAILFVTLSEARGP